jgi:transposase
MGKTRKVYPAEFKHEAVGLTKQPNATVEGVARDLGMSSSALHRWIREHKDKGEIAFPGHGKPALTAEQSEIQRLRKENEQLRLEREILKKATLFFARESQ